jgi:lipopolysaccharide/colanic/teichoic acid biosynthesis glycosyltransferase
MKATEATEASADTRQAGGLALLDRFAVLLALPLTAPLMMVIAAAVVFDSGWPIFFPQERLGLNARRFRVYKFRKFPSTLGRNTMPLTLANDSRCTRVGGFLAKTKLDELPQLWNVALGDMAVVGPRPEVPEFEACFTGPFRRILDFRPGIFGPSQATFRAEGLLYPPNQDPREYYLRTLFPAKAALDLAYYPSRTLFSDAIWVLRSILAVCGSKRFMPALLAPQPGADQTPAAVIAKDTTSR